MKDENKEANNTYIEMIDSALQIIEEVKAELESQKINKIIKNLTCNKINDNVRIKKSKII